MKNYDYTPTDEELVFTSEDVQRALSKLDHGEVQYIMNMAQDLSLMLPNVSIDSALVLLAEMGIQPNKIQKLRRLRRE